MSRARTLALWLVVLAIAAPAWAATPASLLPPQEKETEEEPKPNIGNLGDWVRSSNLAEIRDQMFYLDALRSKEPVSVFRRDKSFSDAKVSVQFKVDSVGSGERAVGLIFGSTDGRTYHSVHVDRRNIILYRSVAGQPRAELDRRGGLNKPEGSWYEVKAECQGGLIRVFFDGKFLFAFNSPQLQPGNVGFYASEARAWVRRLDFDGRPVQLPKAWKLE